MNQAMRMGETLYLAMALYGSGTQSPVGIFESEDLAWKAIRELGKPTGYSIIPMSLNQNWEAWARVERDRYQDYLDQEIRGNWIYKMDQFHVHHVDSDIGLNQGNTLCGTTTGKKWKVISVPTKQKRRDVCSICREIAVEKYGEDFG